MQQVTAEWQDATWQAYEIHMGRTEFTAEITPLLQTSEHWEGIRQQNIWGTYLHGLFETSELRRSLASAAGINSHHAPDQNWQQHKESVYGQMADCIEEHLDLATVVEYLEHTKSKR